MRPVRGSPTSKRRGKVIRWGFPLESDDYRQSITSGNKAVTGNSYHGGSRRGGYGYELAADVGSVKGETRSARWLSSERLWKWIDAHGEEYGIGRPYLDKDPPHIAPIGGKEYADKRGVNAKLAEKENAATGRDAKVRLKPLFSSEPNTSRFDASNFFLTSASGTKRLELVRQLMPKAAAVAMLVDVNPTLPQAEIERRDVQAAAHAIGPVLDDEWLAEPLCEPLSNQACDDVDPTAGSKANDDAHRLDRIGLRPGDTRYRGQRGSARGQMQKLSAGKFQFEPPPLVSLFDHLVGAGDERRRHVETDRLGCLQVDDELELHCPQNRQVGRLLAFENAAGVNAELALPIDNA
jgi:hypothetical protein